MKEKMRSGVMVFAGINLVAIAKRSRGVVPLLLPLMEYLDSGITLAFPRCIIVYVITVVLYCQNVFPNRKKEFLV